MRKKALFFNTATSLSYMMVTIICGFILPRFILLGYGSDINGLVSSISQFLSFITFMDLGVGAVIQSSYYKLLAENDKIGLSLLYVSSKHYFRVIAIILIGYVIGLCYFYPILVNSSYSTFDIDILIIAMAIGLFAQFFLSVADQILLNADQKLYIQSSIQIITVLLNTIISIVLIYVGASIQIVKIGSSIVFLSRPIFYHFYVKKHYQIDRKINTKGYKIEQKWNGLAQHTATVIMNNTDIIVLSMMSQISSVSIYAVYTLVTNGIKLFINSLSNGFFSLLGDLNARNEKEKLMESFFLFQWMISIVIVIFFSIAVLLILPFVQLYTSGVADADYNQPVFAYILIAGQAVFCFRIPFNTMICSAGHYKQTQLSAVIEAASNIFFSIMLVYKFGLIGVALGTLFAISYRTVSFCNYLHNEIIFIRYSVIIKQFLVDLMEMCIIIFWGQIIFRYMPTIDSIFWLLFAGVVLFIMACFVVLVSNLFFYKEEILQIKEKIYQKTKEKGFMRVRT